MAWSSLHAKRTDMYKNGLSRACVNFDGGFAGSTDLRLQDAYGPWYRESGGWMVGGQRMLWRTMEGGRYWEKEHTGSESLIAKEIPSITEILSMILSKAKKKCVELLQRLLGMEVEKARVCWRCWGSWGIAQLYRGWRWGLLGRDKHPQPWLHLKDNQRRNLRELKSYRNRGCLTSLKANMTQFAHKGGEAWNVLVTYSIQFSETSTGWILTTLF